MLKHALSALLFLSAAPALAQLPDAEPGDPAHPETVIDFGETQPLTIVTDEGEVGFTVWLADTDEERARGLMFREELADDAGMLFDFETVRPVSMWMRNTLIPLDLLFVSEEGEIVKIISNARPQSLRSLPSDFPILGVLELRGGRAGEAGIEPGDVIVHPLFATTAEDEAAEDVPSDDASGAEDAAEGDDAAEAGEEADGGEE